MAVRFILCCLFGLRGISVRVCAFLAGSVRFLFGLRCLFEQREPILHNACADLKPVRQGMQQNRALCGPAQSPALWSERVDIIPFFRLRAHLLEGDVGVRNTVRAQHDLEVQGASLQENYNHILLKHLSAARVVGK